jgi:hypothetical protein
MDLSSNENRVFSQNGEDGVTVALINAIYGEDARGKYYVEFGVENGRECNTRILRERYGWSGLQMDGGYSNPAINLQREYIRQDNIVDLFRKYNVPTNINLLSVDIDYNDFYCLHAILEQYTCDIIICEYNASILPPEDKVVIYNPHGRWDGTNYFGASVCAYNALATRYGYTLVYCENKGVNCFFIRNDIIRDRNLNFINMGDPNKIYKIGRYSSGPNGSHPQDPRNRQYISSTDAMQVLYRTSQ